MPQNKIFHKVSPACRQASLWLPVLVWAYLIFTVSSGAVPKVGTSFWFDFVVKKLAHVLVYSIFAILNYRALTGEKVESKKAAIYSVIIAFVYGATDELHQSFIPGREPRFRDVIIDTIGASGTMYFIHKFFKDER